MIHYSLSLSLSSVISSQAYYREGMAHQELGNWEEAAQAYFEGCRVENENTELIKLFQHAMKMAKEDHKAKQED